MSHLFHKHFILSVTNWAIIKQWINNYIYAVKSKQQIHITKCVFVRVLAVIMHERMFHRWAFYHTIQSVITGYILNFSLCRSLLNDMWWLESYMPLELISSLLFHTYRFYLSKYFFVILADGRCNGHGFFKQISCRSELFWIHVRSVSRLLTMVSNRIGRKIEGK